MAADSALSPEEEESLALVTAFQNAARASKAKSVLGLLLERLESGNAGVSQEELLEAIFGSEKRPEDGGVSALRSLTSRLRTDLEQVYRGRPPGSKRLPRLALGTAKAGTYGLEFVRSSQSNGASLPASDKALQQFWEPHLDCPDDQRQIQTSDRLFIRFGNDYYFRDASEPSGINWGGFIESAYKYLDKHAPETKNQPRIKQSRDTAEHLRDALISAAARAIAESLDRPKCDNVVEAFLKEQFRADLSRHYVSAGEAVGMTYLSEYFASQNKPLIFGDQPNKLSDRGDANLIQVGKPLDTDKVIVNALSSLPFTLTRKGISYRKPKQAAHRSPDDSLSFEVIGNPAPERNDEHVTHVEGDAFTTTGGPFTKYVLVTRCRNRIPANTITNIVSNHGRATEAVCEFLVQGHSVADLLEEKLEWLDDSMTAHYFQLVFEVKLVRQQPKQRAIGVSVRFLDGGWWNDPELTFSFD